MIARFWWVSDPAPEPISADWQSSIHVLAGNGTSGLRDDDGRRAQFMDPYDAAVGQDGLVYVSDGAGGNRIRVIGRDGQVATFAGGDVGFADGKAHQARFDTPSG